MQHRPIWIPLAVVLAALMAMPAGAQLAKGDPAPTFRAMDINGNEVDLERVLEQKPDLVILYFFTVDTGKEIARRLQMLDKKYGREKLSIIALGLERDREALKQFATDLNIEYYVLPDTEEVRAQERFGPFQVLPLTCLVAEDRTILNVLAGSGESQVGVITAIAKVYFQKKQTDTTKELGELAAESGENPADAKEIVGYAYVEEGKLDEAQAAFTEAGSATGQAKVALEKHDLGQAKALAQQAGTAYADAILGEALMMEGKLDEAEAAYNTAASKPADDWQASEAKTGAGRVNQEQGEIDQAIALYQEAVKVDPYNIVALSNEGAAHRQTGNLDKASEVLARAQEIRNDDMVAIMLKQVRDEMSKANDTARRELIRKQIQDLQARYEAQKAAGTDRAADGWTSPPLVVAFLPSENPAPVFFERAGTDLVIKRELEGRLQENDRVTVVEREVIDQLLQELNLGSSDVADPNTQLQLGKLLAAQWLGFIEFTQVGAEPMLYLRMVDTETTTIDMQLVEAVDQKNLSAFLDKAVAGLLGKMLEQHTVQGLIADAADESQVIINLGARHGVDVGERFVILEEGEPIQVGNRTIPGRKIKAGTLEITSVEDEFSIGKVVEKREGVQLAKEMKIRQAT